MIKPEKNPFHDLAAAVFEQIESGVNFEHSCLGTFSIVLWKLLSEKTGDQGFKQASKEADQCGNISKLIHQEMTEFAKKYPDESQGLFHQVLKHVFHFNETPGVLARFMDFLNHIDLVSLFDQGSRDDYISTMDELAFKKGMRSGFAVSLNIIRLMRAVLSIQQKDKVFAFGCAPAVSILDSIVNEKSAYLCAQDMNINHAIMAKIHLALFNIDHSRIVPQSLFEQPAFVKEDKLETFDCVFGVPHMGTIPSDQAEKLRNDPYGRFPAQLIDRFSREMVTLAHALEAMKPRIGRGAILLPQKFLSMMNTHKIRSYMVLMNYIDTIATLPRYLFPGLTTDMALLVFKMNKQDKKVLFIDAEPFCSLADRSIDQDRFMELYAGRKESAHSMLVDNSVILGREASLFPSVYQEVKPDKERKSLQHLRDELSGIDHRLQQVQKKLDDALGRMIES